MKDFMAKFILQARNLWALLKAFVIRRRTDLLIGAGVLLALNLFFLGFFYLTTDVFYYSHRLRPLETVADRRPLKPIPPESRLQAYVRQYIGGGGGYQASLPYGGSERVVGIYHDKEEHNLVIDWDESFLRNWQEASPAGPAAGGSRALVPEAQRSGTTAPDRDTELLLKSLKKNFPLKTVRFLIRGRPAGLLWREYRLDEGVPMEKISLK